MSARWEALWYPRGRRSLVQRLTAAVLWFPAWLYRVAIAARGAAYDRGWLAQTRVEGARVISVGNLHVGGAGKTPVVIFLAQRARKLGRRVAVLSRGYGRTSREALRFTDQNAPPAEVCGDEPRLIAKSCPGVEVWVGANRAKLALNARAAGAELLLLDDGFQHRRLARDLDIVVVDGQAGFGNGRLLPAGPLREPPTALRRAGLVWVRDPRDPEATWAPGIPHVNAALRLDTVRSPDGEVLPLSELSNGRWVVLTAIARPMRLFDQLEQAGAVVSSRHVYPDHAVVPAAELERLVSAADARGARVLCTEKDAVRLPASHRVWVVTQRMELLSSEQALREVLAL